MNNINNEICYEYIINQIRENRNSKLCFWGASLFLREFIAKYDLKEFDIVGIVDSDESRVGEKFGSYDIVGFEKLKENSDIKIIFTINKKYEIRYNDVLIKIKKLGLKNELLSNVFVKERIDYNDELCKKISSNRLLLVDSKGREFPISHIDGLEIVWEGYNNVVKIGANPIPKFYNCKFTCGDSSEVVIGSSIHSIKNLTIFSKYNSKVLIDDNFSCFEAFITMSNEPNMTLKIGKDCMFSNRIYIRNTDGHVIYDDEFNVLNEAHNVIIGNHVWCGYGVTILKNSVIPDNTIIGSCVLVNKVFEEEKTIIAGVPAKIIKRNVNWGRERIDDFKQKHSL